jgi:hypothetical protein
MITLATYNEKGDLVKLRFYSSAAQLWEDFERYDELRIKLMFERPLVNVLAAWGHRINKEDIFPMYVFPEGEWQNWGSFYAEYLKNWKGRSRK